MVPVYWRPQPRDLYTNISCINWCIHYSVSVHRQIPSLQMATVMLIRFLAFHNHSAKEVTVKVGWIIVTLATRLLTSQALDSLFTERWVWLGVGVDIKSQVLTHWNRSKMADVFAYGILNVFSRIEVVIYWFKSQRYLPQRVELIINQFWFR